MKIKIISLLLILTAFLPSAVKAQGGDVSAQLNPLILKASKPLKPAVNTLFDQGDIFFFGEMHNYPTALYELQKVILEYNKTAKVKFTHVFIELEEDYQGVIDVIKKGVKEGHTRKSMLEQLCYHFYKALPENLTDDRAKMLVLMLDEVHDYLAAGVEVVAMDMVDTSRGYYKTGDTNLNTRNSFWASKIIAANVKGKAAVIGGAEHFGYHKVQITTANAVLKQKMPYKKTQVINVFSNVMWNNKIYGRARAVNVGAEMIGKEVKSPVIYKLDNVMATESAPYIPADYIILFSSQEKARVFREGILKE